MLLPLYSLDLRKDSTPCSAPNPASNKATAQEGQDSEHGLDKVASIWRSPLWQLQD